MMDNEHEIMTIFGSFYFAFMCVCMWVFVCVGVWCVVDKNVNDAGCLKWMENE